MHYKNALVLKKNKNQEFQRKKKKIFASLQGVNRGFQGWAE